MNRLFACSILESLLWLCNTPHIINSITDSFFFEDVLYMYSTETATFFIGKKGVQVCSIYYLALIRSNSSHV